MDWKELKLSKDTDDPKFWVNLFSDHPQALFDLIYDCYATKHGKLGRGRRRKMDGSLEEVWKMFYGEDG